MRITRRITCLICIISLAAGIGVSAALAVPNRGAGPNDDPVQPTPTPVVKEPAPTKSNPTPNKVGAPTPGPQNGPNAPIVTKPSGDQRGSRLGDANTPLPSGPGTRLGVPSANGSGPAMGTEEKGVRDPADFSRPPQTVRTSYSMDVFPPTTQEEVKYTSSASVSDVQAFYTKYLVDSGWLNTEQNENNGGPNGTRQVYGHWTKTNNDSLDLRLIDLKPGVLEITVNLKRISIPDPLLR